MTDASTQISSIDDLFRLDPLARFQALIAGPRFDAYLRTEPILFDRANPFYGIACRVPGCGMHSTQVAWFCSGHLKSRRVAIAQGVGEAAWLAGALPFPARAKGPTGRLPPCRFCPERDAVTGDLCQRHSALLGHARRTLREYDEETWDARQAALPGTGECRVGDCFRRSVQVTSLCERHHRRWSMAGQPQGLDMKKWLLRAGGIPEAGWLFFAGLQPLVAAEIRYALWTHTMSPSPAWWHPMLLRRLVRSCVEREVRSILDLNPSDKTWTRQQLPINRIVREMLKDIRPVHHTRADTRALGFLDTNYWGMRFPDRRSAFDLAAIPQPWLRDLTWDYLAGQLDLPSHPRTQGPFEQARRSIVCFGTYLLDCDPHRGAQPNSLSESTAKEFVADLRRCATNGRPMRGVFKASGNPSITTATTYALTMNALRRVMRWAMDSGAASALGLPREFIVAIPFGGAVSFKNPRPFTDPVLRELSDPTNIALLAEMDSYDSGWADIWSIQVRCGRRIGEVVRLRLDCVGEHLARTWMWVDMTKVGKLDYAVQVPRDVYDLIRARQAKTIERFRLRHGAEPTAAQRRAIALFPSPVTNPTFVRSVSPSKFAVTFKAWIESERINLPGHTTHQARHTLATRLVNAGASMTHVKRVLGHVSERMGDSYVLIAGSQVEPFLQQVWVTGPGNARPGEVVLTPTETERSTAEALMVDLAAIPTEHGLCTFKPVVGGFDCPFERRCDSCEHFVITGADYGYWKRQEQRWAAMAEGAPDEGAREYIYAAFERSSQALAGLEKALLALGLLDQAKDLDLRSPHQDFFNPIWAQGWRAGDLVEMGGGAKALSPGPADDAGKRAAS